MSFEEILEKVKENPVLWDPTHKYYKLKAVQAEAWVAIAKELGTEEKLVKSRWKYLKDHCRKELKKLMAGDTEKSKWQYFDQLDFIKEELLSEGKSKYFIEHKHETDGEPPNKMPKTDTPESSSSTGQEKKILLIINKLYEISKKLDGLNPADEESRNDPDYLFLMSILPTMHHLTAVQKFKFRGKVNEWLLEALAQNDFPVTDQFQCKFEVSDS